MLDLLLAPFFFIAQYLALEVLLVSFALLIFLVWKNAPSFKAEFCGIKKTTWLLLLCLLALSFFVRYSNRMCPATDGQFYEHVYYADFFLKHGALGVNDLGHTKGYSFILALGFFLFGESVYTAQAINMLISILTVFLVFLITFLATKSERYSLLAALIFSLMPLHIYFWNYLASRETALFFVCLSALFFMVAARQKTKESLLLAATALAISPAIRIENIAYSAAILLSVPLFFKKTEFKSLLMPAAVFALLLLPLVPYFVQAPYSFGYIPKDTPKELLVTNSRGEMERLFDEKFPGLERPSTFSLVPFSLAMSKSLEIMSQEKNYPVLLLFFTVFSITGILKRRELAVLWFWLLAVLVFYGTYYGGWMVFIELWHVLLLAPLAILISAGMMQIGLFAEWFFKKFGGEKAAVFFSVAVFAFFLLLSIFAFLPSGVFSAEGLEKNSVKECVYSDIASAGLLIGTNACIIAEPCLVTTGTSALRTIQMALPGKKIVSSPEECGSAEKYFFEFSEKVVRVEKPEICILGAHLRVKCSLQQLQDYNALALFRVECNQLGAS